MIYRKVSVLTAVFNEEMFLSQCINSVLSQPSIDLEHIIVDDFSEDKTLSLAQYYSRLDSRVRVYKNLKKGKVNAFNLAFAKASGDIFVFLGGDDYLAPSTLAYRASLFSSVDDRTPTCFHHALVTHSIKPAYSQIRIPRSPRIGNISGQTTTFNTSAAQLIFPIPSSLPSEDSWSCLISEHLCKSFPDSSVVVYYRIHDQNTVPRNASFPIFSSYLKKREAALSVFRDVYPDYLKLVSTDLKLALLRQRGKTLSILFLPGIPIVKRLRYAAFSKPFLYRIRQFFFKLFSGL